MLLLQISSPGDVDSLYTTIVSLINNATDICIPRSKFKPFIKPYWNRELSYLHNEMNSRRCEWLNENRPRNDQCPSYRNYKASKNNFRNTHRVTVQAYLSSLEQKIDTAAEMDNNEFWKLINRRKKNKKTETTFKMNFNGQSCENPVDINLGWKNYFSELYTPKDHNFESAYAITCDEELSDIKLQLSTHRCDDIKITINMVEQALKSCKKKKACDNDLIYYENIMYGGPLLLSVITKLFNYMSLLSHVPVDMKTGIISTLYKGSNKNKTDPNSYRAISLCSIILKLYEKVLLKMIEQSDTLELNTLQGGFQRNINCKMTSFLLRESIYFAKENNSKLYACFLDVRQAFDHVSHNILMLKLYKTGVNKSIFKVILNMFENVYSCVKSHGQTSDWFPILQGTRQGQVMSPYLYLIFINDLMDKLDKSPYGLKINDSGYGCPTSADDMVLSSLTKNGLEQLMSICHKNSIRERYTYNANKCNVVVFNERLSDSPNNLRQWRFGQCFINETDKYVHLGILCSKDMCLRENIKDACTKLRKTYFGLADCGVHQNGLHPITVKHLYQTIVLSRALYGCELWSSISDTQLKSLERVHVQCIKYMQSLPKQTRSDVALALIGLTRIEYEIDKRKLLLFGQLCSLNKAFRIQTIFANRLIQFMSHPRKTQGFMPDIYRILGKYHLTEILTEYISSAFFPTLRQWKKRLKLNIHKSAEFDFRARVIQEDSLNNFLNIQGEIAPNSIWYFSQLYRDYLPYCRTVTFIIGKLFARKYSTICPKCNLITDTVAEHLILFCSANNTLRHSLLCNIHKICGSNKYDQLCNLSPLNQIIELVSGFPSLNMYDKQTVAISKTTFRHLHHMTKSLRVMFT